MEDHSTWIKRGFEDGVFLLVGSFQPKLGGAILAHNTSLPDLQMRVNEDPFFVQDVVLEITRARTHDQSPLFTADCSARARDR